MKELREYMTIDVKKMMKQLGLAPATIDALLDQDSRRFMQEKAVPCRNSSKEPNDSKIYNLQGEMS
ncbi:hypothetical protein [Paenibacillus mesophilus]|uniref:hypothetical protein n=1 Tax=Paenibacillus mesophilus TaxID=2582849 RepID=UPI00192E4DC5|nr:hypothetical protein [Paenibacillus mesophilus]